MITVYIANLGKYNEGYLSYKKLKLPATEEEIKNALKDIGIDGVKYEEYFLSDWESIEGIEISEYSSLENLNEIAEKLETLSEYDLKLCKAIMKNENCSLDEAIEQKNNRLVINLEKKSNLNDFENLAYSYIDEVYEDVSKLDRETLEKHFDFDSFGRELSYNYFIDNQLNIAVSNN